MASSSPPLGGIRGGDCGINEIRQNHITPQPRPLLMKNNIVRNGASAKKNHQVSCSHCSSTAVVRNGTYVRANPENDTEITVQRYLCKCPECPWQTFSILPESVLPVIRHSYKTLFSCHTMFNKGMNQATVARQLGLNRGVVKRLKSFCCKFMVWLKQEKKIAEWGSEPLRFWPDFTRDFSQHFFPKRWIKPASTQHIPIY